MKDKLRELAGEMRNELCSDFAQKLEAILDAEGDVGAVGWQDKVNEIANNIGESLNAGCDQDAVDRINVYVDELFALATHPARSGVVSDEDVIHAWGVFCHSKEIADATTGDKNTFAHMRAALEHFAKGERHV